MEFNFKIKGDRLISGEILTGNSGNVNVYTCSFEIANNAGFTWLCVFRQGDEAYQQAIENGKCVIPKEVLARAGDLQIGCYGTDNGMRISTNWLKFNISDGAYCDATMPEEPTPDVWEVLVMNSLPYIGENGNWYVYDKVKKTYKDSGNASRGEKGDTGDKGDAGLDGLDGKDGYTPQKGVDYWTEEDITSIIDDIYDIKQDIVQESGADKYRAMSQNAVSRLFSNALRGIKTGESVVVTDIAPTQHTMGVMVKNKNLIPYPYVDTTKKVNGITFTDNGDGSITANGTATANAYIILQNIILQPGTYTLSGCPSGGSSDKYYLRVINTVDYKNYISTGEAKAFTITESGSYNVGINVNSGVVAENLIFKPQLEEGTTATAYTPYVDVGTVSVGRYGANLLNCPNFDKGTKADDGTISFQNAEGTAAIYAYTPFVTFPAGTYIASVDTLSLSEGGDYNLYIQHNATNDFTKPISNKTTYRVFRLTAPTKIRVVGEIKAGTDVKFKAQMNLGNTILPFEPYIEPTTHTPNADGTVQGVTSLYPSTTLLTDTEGAVVTCEYNRDINKAFEELTNAIISLGGNV